MEEEDLTLSAQAIQEYLDKNETTAMDLAAAFLKLELVTLSANSRMIWRRSSTCGNLRPKERAREKEDGKTIKIWYAFPECRERNRN